MKRQQLVLILSGVFLVIILFVFGKTVNKKNSPLNNETVQENNGSENLAQKVEFASLLSKAKEKLNNKQNEQVLVLENAVVRGNVLEQQIHAYHKLAKFWKDTAKIWEPYAYYTAEAAKLENSEKNLTFAAQMFVDNLLEESDASMQNWLATNAKVLLEKSLAINANNDSNKIALGACYIFGNISNQPMQGILPVKEIADKNPNNIFAQFVLGLGGKRSGQYDKAIERFNAILKIDSLNLRAAWHLAECYDLKGDKQNAVKWYKLIASQQQNKEIKTALLNRIKELSN